VGERVQQEDLFGKPQVVEPEQRKAQDGAARPDAPPLVPEVRPYPKRGLPHREPADPPDSPVTREDALAAARALLSRSGSPWVLDEAAARHWRRVQDYTARGRRPMAVARSRVG
jgi:hypothetical protein